MSGAGLAAPSWLNEGPLARLLAILDSDGEEARVIGGAVRNWLMGEPVGEVDVATTALPDEVTRRAAASGFKAVPTGAEHGTVTVVIDRYPIEVTTLREDIETFGRHATVRFGRDWKADAERRDFTINALSMTRDGTVVDLVGGLPDITARRVRFIGDAEARIREDYLRILRFFRFHARYGAGEPDPEGLRASIKLREGLAQLSRERVRMEVMKLLVAKRAPETAAAMADAGLIEPILGVPLIGPLKRMTAIEAALGLEPDAVRRFGAFCVHVSDDAARLRERLRLANAEEERLATMAERWHEVSPAMPGQARRALLYRLGPDAYRERVLFAWSRSTDDASDAGWRDLAELPGRWQAPKFPLAAAAFIARGVAKGPALGAALAGAEEAWIAADFPHDGAVLDTLLADFAARSRA